MCAPWCWYCYIRPEKSIRFGNVIPGKPEMLAKFFGKTLLSEIFKQFMQNLRSTRIDFPDALLEWNCFIFREAFFQSTAWAAGFDERLLRDHVARVGSCVACRDVRTVIFYDPDPVLFFKTQSRSNDSPKISSHVGSKCKWSPKNSKNAAFSQQKCHIPFSLTHSKSGSEPKLWSHLQSGPVQSKSSAMFIRAKDPAGGCVGKKSYPAVGSWRQCKKVRMHSDGIIEDLKNQQKTWKNAWCLRRLTKPRGKAANSSKKCKISQIECRTKKLK